MHFIYFNIIYRIRTMPKKPPNTHYPILLDTAETNNQYQYRYQYKMKNRIDFSTNVHVYSTSLPILWLLK